MSDERQVEIDTAAVDIAATAASGACIPPPELVTRMLEAGKAFDADTSRLAERVVAAYESFLFDTIDARAADPECAKRLAATCFLTIAAAINVEMYRSDLGDKASPGRFAIAAYTICNDAVETMPMSDPESEPAA